MNRPTLLDVFLAELDDGALEILAERLAPRIAARNTPTNPATDDWLSTKQAAKHLGLTATALHKLTAARAIPFEQDAPGCKCWFRRAQLDEWRVTGTNVPRNYT